jgi:hypothetical protein
MHGNGINPTVDLNSDSLIIHHSFNLSLNAFKLSVNYADVHDLHRLVHFAGCKLS